ncbi:hypothetical protein [Nocardia transvalensis]|uniref:hypothetical protein n=1 Tax=Nocardia transvalensis TaxID=37333 RepID=UPI0018940332|nr:hypothetical protein [Nocardia transvalensis]MBF6333320.1 hypothetical protein [Nocardia transvalensis]
MTGLVHLIESFGEEIEADLFERSWDLLDYFRGVRPWPQLVRLLRRLPMWSHYQSALLMDPDIGERRAREEIDEGAAPQPLAPLHYDLSALLMLRQIDITKELIRVIASVFGDRPAAPLPPEPRPTTAEAMARAQRDRDQVRDVLTRLGVTQ